MRYDPTAALAALSSAPSDRPFVVGQLGQSLDGRIATPTGKSKYISGAAALGHLHRLRAAVDAVVVGVNTVIADDPQLTVRLVDGPSPAKVVIDPSGRMPHAPRMLEDGPGRAVAKTSDGRVLVVRDHDNPELNGLTGRVDVISIERGPEGDLPPEAIIAALFERGFRKILIEGGSTTLSRALSAGVVDALHVMVAPVILGSGTPGLALPPIDELDEGLHPRAQAFAFPDGDVLFACDLRTARRATHPVSTSAEAGRRSPQASLDPVVAGE